MLPSIPVVLCNLKRRLAV